MIGNVLTLKQLEALVWVADLGSFRKAAQHLGTTQPNISSRVAGLEKTLGIVLMQRDAGSIRLTDKGREILDSARKTLREAEQIVAVADRHDLIADRLRLGVTELVACTWLHRFLRKIKASYPALNVELTVDLSINLDRDFSANKLDLVIQTSPFGSPASGIVELGKFPYVWVADPTIASALQGPQSVTDLFAHSVLTHARHTQAYVELIAHIDGRSPASSRVVSSSSLASCVQMAADGMGVTLVPKALVAAGITAGTLVEIDVDWTPAPLRFAARYQSEKTASFIAASAQFAAEVVSEL